MEIDSFGLTESRNKRLNCVCIDLNLIEKSLLFSTCYRSTFMMGIELTHTWSGALQGRTAVTALPCAVGTPKWFAAKRAFNLYAESASARSTAENFYRERFATVWPSKMARDFVGRHTAESFLIWCFMSAWFLDLSLHLTSVNCRSL